MKDLFRKRRLESIENFVADLRPVMSAEFDTTRFMRSNENVFSATSSLDNILHLDAVGGRKILPGSGVDVCELKSDKSYAFVSQDYTPPTPIAGTLVVDYFDSVASVVEATGGSNSLGLSLITSDIVFGASFGSSRLRQSQSRENSRHIVISSNPAYSFVELPNLELSSDAKALFTEKGFDAFFRAYGTHFVSEVLPQSLYALVISFHSRFEDSMSTFEQKAGLDIGIPDVFGLDFQTATKDALKDSKGTVSMSFKEFTVPGIQMPDLPPDLLSLLGQATQRFNHYEERLREQKMLPLTKFRLRPFAEILKPELNIPTSVVASALAQKSDVDDLLNDFNTMRLWPGVWSGRLDDDAILELSRKRSHVVFDIYSVLANPTTPVVDNLRMNLSLLVQQTEALLTDNLFPPIIKVRKTFFQNVAEENELELEFEVDKRLSKPRVVLLGHAKGVLSNELTVFPVSGVGDEPRIWGTGKFKAKPVANIDCLIQVSDIAGRTREAVVTTASDSATCRIPDTFIELY